jgi:hypothetical protein
MGGEYGGAAAHTLSTNAKNYLPECVESSMFVGAAVRLSVQ